MHQGLKHGCPLSSLLFMLVVEIFTLRIKQNKDIVGYSVKLNGKHTSINISQYGDDTTLFLNGVNKIPEVLKEINLVSDNAGSNLNIEKSEGLFIGHNRMLKETYFGVNCHRTVTL